MKIPIGIMSLFIGLLSVAPCTRGETTELKAVKDTFGRSNNRNRNSGASKVLYIAHASQVRTIVGFDLSTVSNRVLSATFRFRQTETMSDAVALTVAPMVQAGGNSEWKEGIGVLGSKGQNARPGEACYAWNAFPDISWMNGKGNAVSSLGDPKLWAAPLVSSKKVEWNEGAWIELPLPNLEMIESVRTSEHPVLTLGIWGSSGKGLYGISSRESGYAPELILITEKDK